MPDTKISLLPAASAAALANEFPINESGATKRLTLQLIADLLFTRINGNSGAAGPYKTLQELNANSADQTSLTPGVVMTTTGVGIGTWKFEYSLLFQTAATTTGWRIANNHTGTVTTYIMHSDFLSTGGAAATGISDAIAAGATAGLHEGQAERVLNATSKSTVGVATANANQLLIVRGIIVVSASGDLEFKLGTEVAGSAVRLMTDSMLELTKVG
ncbi:MAG: hypothetical protein H0W42_02985 [Gemmatimonadaceae bacterium]|nr:hypothetical protein [Gemmatimonadaceae bacterium]